jgi:asparagine N-glycosylation enzyme membrane subunit Stt3
VKRISLQRLRGLQLAAFLLLYFFLVAAAYLGGADWVILQTWAVVLTGAVVIWYTWETMRLGRTAREQIEVQIRPFVILHPNSAEFAVENVGQGPALNVRIKDAVIDKPSNVVVR